MRPGIAHLDQWTVSWIVAVWEFPPPVPVTMILNVPVVARRLTVTFIVELPLPPAIDEGLKLILVPLLCPDADNEIEEMLPRVTPVAIVDLPEVPLVMLSDVGFAEMVKLDGAVVTFRLTVVVATVPSEPIPVMVTENVPVAAAAVEEKVRTELPDGAIGLVPKPADTPEGRPETVNVMFEL